jgi:lipopolysaccharide export system permease protein
LSQVDESDLTDPKQITGSQTVSGTWKTNLTPDKLGVVALDPDALSISGLHNYVKYLKSSGQDAGRYQLNMWSKIFQPMSVAVMMLMALSFIFGPLRSVPMGVRVVTGISFGFVFYVLDQIFRPADAGLWHPADYRCAAAKRQFPPDQPLAASETFLINLSSLPVCRERG